jgi:hypothetical protein
MTTFNNSSSRIIKIGAEMSTSRTSSGGASTHVQQLGNEYSLVRVEQLDQTAALEQQRVNNWRYTGPDGLPYRTRARYETNFRVRLHELGGPWSRANQQRRTQWFNAAQPGGDAALPDFQCWAALLLRQDLVHPDDVQSWRATFVDVEGAWPRQVPDISSRQHLAHSSDLGSSTQRSCTASSSSTAATAS